MLANLRLKTGGAGVLGEEARMSSLGELRKTARGLRRVACVSCFRADEISPN